jgi:hypothetical protein
MSDSRLPAEMLDRVVDNLHNRPDVLKQCCLVSKSWTPRTRKHLFAHARFPTAKSLQSWKKTFPDPSTSPAHYAKIISVGCPEAVTAADAKAGGWLSGFSRVERLEVGNQRSYHESPPLVSLHGFSSALKSLLISFAVLPSPSIINFILSFPSLEDLAVTVHDADDGDGSGGPPTAARPPFTGSLKLYLRGGMEPFTRRLLSLPGGIHFRKLILTWFRGEDLLLTMTLVETCSQTLESLEISDARGASIRYLHPHL